MDFLISPDDTTFIIQMFNYSIVNFSLEENKNYNQTPLASRCLVCPLQSFLVVAQDEKTELRNIPSIKTEIIFCIELMI